MPTSSYMPSLTVEVAFDGGFRVPMTDWTWTDVSDYVELAEGISISGGRGDERSTADANTLSLTLDNSDGRFTAGLTSGAYYPDVVLYKPIRVRADPVDGAISTRFTGYITSWPVEWEATSAYAKATITASSRLARLGLNAAWRSLIEESILADSPVAYYPLGDPEGSTLAADVSGLGADPLTLTGDSSLPVVFGQATGPGTDDLTAATFAGGEWLEVPRTSTGYAGITIACFSSGTTLPTAATPSIIASCGGVSIGVEGVTGNVVARSGGLSIAGSSVLDGVTRHLATTWDGTTLRLYVDGVLANSSALAGSPAIDRVTAGGHPDFETFTGAVAHVAAFGEALSAPQLLVHATAGLSAYAGETTDTRFERYADMAGIPAAEVSAEAGSTTVAHVDTTGANIVDLLRMVEQAEAGVIFDARDGTLTMHNRAHRYSTTAVVTLDMNKHEVEADYSPRLDASALFNDITVTGVVQAHLTSPASIAANGVATASFTTISEDDDEPQSLAGWALHQFAVPQPRVPTLTVDALAQVGKTVDCADVMAVTLGDKVTVTNHPAQAGATTTSYFVEGWTETYGPESLTITWNVSPTYAEDNMLILDDATYGDFSLYPLAL
jgi:hypothetical protein